MRLSLPLVILFLIVLGCAAPRSGDEPSPGAPANKLELLSMNAEYTSDAYLTVTGQVRNISSEKISAVEAIVQTYESNGSMIGADSAMIEFEPLLPLQTSPFKVIIRKNPAMQKYDVRFKTIYGTEIGYTDSRQHPTKEKKKK